MNSITFDNKSEAEDYLRRQLAGSDRLYDEFPELSEAMLFEFEIVDYPASPHGTLGALVKRFRWVIRNEDLQIIEAIFDGLKNAAGASFFMTATTTDKNALMSAAIGVLSTFYKVTKNAVNKSRQLTKEQFEVILCLKNHPDGLTFQQLLSQLNLAKQKISEPRLAEVVEGLKAVYSNGGTKMELVILDNGFLKVCNI